MPALNSDDSRGFRVLLRALAVSADTLRHGGRQGGLAAGLLRLPDAHELIDRLSGTSPDQSLVEMVELRDHALASSRVGALVAGAGARVERLDTAADVGARSGRFPQAARPRGSLPRGRRWSWPAVSAAPLRRRGWSRGRSLRGWTARRAAPPAGGAIPNGMRTVKVEPRPTSLVTVTAPPCICAISWTSASPMPEPSWVRERAPWTR